jgi:hypothetical protein
MFYIVPNVPRFFEKIDFSVFADRQGSPASANLRGAVLLLF